MSKRELQVWNPPFRTACYTRYKKLFKLLSEFEKGEPSIAACELVEADMPKHLARRCVAWKKKAAAEFRR